MGQPTVENTSPFKFETLFLADEGGQPLFVSVIKATYNIRNGEVLLAEEQAAVSVAGEFWGDPENSSYKYEPDTAFFKAATDVVLIGHAYAPELGTTEVHVGIRVGPVQKVVKVIGDRMLIRRAGFGAITRPKPFEKIPLVYERAFGGRDKRDAVPDKYGFEPRNPVGTGYRYGSPSKNEDVRLPNLEDRAQPFQRYGDTPPPAGFGFISPHWQPRASFAGTYDEVWDRDRKPLLPKDFDRRFFNAASPGLVAPSYLKGDEPVVVLNASPEGRVAFYLPGIVPPECNVELRGHKYETLHTQLDTVIINMDERLLFMTWRAHLPLRTGPHDLVTIKVHSNTEIPVFTSA